MATLSFHRASENQFSSRKKRQDYPTPPTFALWILIRDGPSDPFEGLPVQRIVAREDDLAFANQSLFPLMRC